MAEADDKTEIIMKISIKLLYIVCAVVVVSSMTTCVNDIEDDPIPVSPYLSSALYIIDQQVYERNVESTKISTMHQLYTGEDCMINAYAMVGHVMQVVSDDGEVKDGKFSITVPALTDDQLSQCKDILEVFFYDWLMDNANCDIKIISGGITIPETEKIGSVVNFIAPFTFPDPPKDMLMREGISGTETSLSAEEIFYFYVKKDCTITANEGGVPTLQYIFTPINLELKKGWNTVCMKETYTVFGVSTYTAEVKNPDFEWVMMTLPTP